MLRKLAVEFTGTFFLVLIVALSGNPVAIGFIVAALVYAGGYISGGHYNPAVTLGVLLSGNMKANDAVAYIVSQMTGGLVASFTYLLITRQYFIPKPGAGVEMDSAFIVEMLFTFLLVSVVHHTAVSKITTPNAYYGIAIGMTVLAAAFSGGPISGGAFNPAVGASPLLIDFGHISENMGSVILYIAGPLTGGALAGIVYSKFSS